MMKRFLFALVLLFSLNFVFADNFPQCYYKKGDGVCSYAGQKLSDGGVCRSCFTYHGSGCAISTYTACSAAGFKRATSGGKCFDVSGKKYDAPTQMFKIFYNGEDGYSCGNDATDIDDNPLPPLCDDELDPYCDQPNPDPGTPDPGTPVYDDDYKPEDPPCQIMVNGKCVFEDPNRKDKICTNGYCKCFEKNENGILKETPCNNNFNFPKDIPPLDPTCEIVIDGECYGSEKPYENDSGDDNNSGDGTHTSSSDNTHGGGGISLDDDNNSTSFNPNTAYDDFNYDFGDLDPNHDLPDPKQIEQDKSKEVDLSSWGVNDYFNSSGQCPAPNTVSLGMFGSFEVSYEYFCSIARIIRAVVIAFAWLSGLLIITRINK